MIETVEHIGIGAGAVLSIFGVIVGICKLIGWFKKKAELKRQRHDEIVFGLSELNRSNARLWIKLEEMDKLRAIARSEDSKIRGDQYLGTIAVITAVREIAGGLNIKINGEVEKYYQQNIEALRCGLGMTPLDATKEMI